MESRENDRRGMEVKMQPPRENEENQTPAQGSGKPKKELTRKNFQKCLKVNPELRQGRGSRPTKSWISAGDERFLKGKKGAEQKFAKKSAKSAKKGGRKREPRTRLAAVISKKKKEKQSERENVTWIS